MEKKVKIGIGAAVIVLGTGIVCYALFIIFDPKVDFLGGSK